MTNPRQEKTLIIFKPDALQRGLVGELISRLERSGLKMVALKMLDASEEQCWQHYNKDEQWFSEKGQKIIANLTKAGKPIEKEASDYGRGIIEALVKFMTCCPLIAMIFEGNQAVGIVKKIVGGTEPLTSDVGTIRGDLTLDSYELSNLDNRAIRNLIHCSDQVEEAQREISIWFQADEIFKYRLVSEHILYDVNLDGIRE